jgi:hypothetical protein
MLKDVYIVVIQLYHVLVVKYITGANHSNIYVQFYVQIMLIFLHYKAVTEIFCIHTSWYSKIFSNEVQWQYVGFTTRFHSKGFYITKMFGWSRYQ